VKTALCIAATDPTAGAGSYADVKTFAAFGVYAYAVTTAVTVQSRAGVESVHPLAPEIVEAQLGAALRDLGTGGISAVKVGMLATAEVVSAVALACGGLSAPMVVDPVLASSSGVPLLDEPGRAALLRDLLPRAHLVTPNLAEASALCGHPVQTREDMERAASEIARGGAVAVLVKGGHLAGAPADFLLA
jgi:hydroxymethylpyrimidine kinase/phosphomethylpyrimidine kinase